ncbi:NifB/NifX family molybdenum-iron cluster-binding protein [Lachnospiraceae bacterium 46-15]
MKLAVTFENGEVFQHFGRTENFKIYDVEDGVIKESRVVNSNGAGHGALAGFLKNEGVDILICGGIGAGAQTALANAGIQLYGGVSGSADEAAAAFLENKLEYNADVKCNHHHHHEGGCGEHTCSH